MEFRVATGGRLVSFGDNANAQRLLIWSKYFLIEGDSRNEAVCTNFSHHMAPCFGLFSSQCPHLASLLFPSRINSRWHEPVRTLKERTPGFNTSRYYPSKLLKQWFKGERSNIFQLMRKLCMEINWKECAFVWRISLSNSLPVFRYITPRPHQLSRLFVSIVGFWQFSCR